MIRFDLTKRLVADRQRFELELSGSIPTGTLIGLVGPSGSGKSTFLRCLAGLVRPNSGRIEVDEAVWYDHQNRVWLSPQRRSIGYLPQDGGLLPHRTVLSNVLFALERPNGAAIAQAHEILAILEMDRFEKRWPRELSGGQSQRVALARTLARGGRVLLLDEPFSALDEDLRARLWPRLREWHRESGATTILVSHTRSEIADWCDEIWEIRDGRFGLTRSAQVASADS